ncbi:MAG: hypothetical protein SOX30_08820, partial [Lachnospiraceae bacterium]|nr:hypothetical protein [Lachnospiraceae bacterium]
MNQVFEIIQAIMRFQKQNAVVEITLNNSEKVTGQIESYTGQQLTVAGRELAITNIAAIQEAVSLSDYLMNRVSIHKMDDRVIDAVLVEVTPTRISYVNDDGQGAIVLSEIASIRLEDKIIYQASPAASPAPEQSVMSAVQSAPEQSVTPASVPADENGLNEFEQAILTGNRDIFKYYINDMIKLQALGYSEYEIDRMLKSVDQVNWEDEPYQIATRFYLMQRNRNGLAKK